MAFRAATVVTLATVLPLNSNPAAARDVILRVSAEARSSTSPLLLLVSIRKQRVRVFDSNGVIASSRISSGQPGFDTPTGVFSILEKQVYHESNIYDGAPMPFMQRVTWSGIALHAGVVPGYRASHGCIRLPASFAKSLFSLTNTGNRVVISMDEAEPVRFEHANLFKPLPAEFTGKTSSVAPGPTRVAANDVGPEQFDLIGFPGISPAMAEALPDAQKAIGKPRSRAEADRFAAEKITSLQAALKTAETHKIAAAEKSKTVLRETEQAMATLTAERKTIEDVRATVKAAEQKQAQAIRTFETYMKSASGGGAKADARSEDKEYDLEDAVLDATIEADRVRNEAARREMAFAEVQTSLAKAETARSAAVANAGDTQAQVKSTQEALAEATKQAGRRNKPLGVFVSLKSKRIYIRQGTEPLLEAPITIASPQGPVGTHVLTAMRYGADANSFEWKLVSAHTPAVAADDQGSRKNKRRDVQQLPLSAGPRMAKSALDAIKIPQEIQDTITELARPGASLIISDRDLSPTESGPGTEFVVLTR